MKATLNGKEMVVNDDGEFDIYFAFPGEEKTFLIGVTDIQNHYYLMQYKISPVIDRDERGANWSPRWRFSLGAGYTLISYREKGVTDFEQKVITVKLATSYRIIPEKLDLGFGGFYNAITISTTSPNGYKIQYLGFNLRAGYHLLDAPSSLRIVLQGGLYFNDSFGTVGFANMYGPQISPEFSYIFNNGHSLFWYGKYAFSFSGTTGISFKDNREVAAGVHYSIPISQFNRFTVGVDVSQLSLSLGTAWASTNTYSLSAGLSF